MRIERQWAMPSRSTFSIPPIRALIEEEITPGIWLDPYSGGARYGTHTNDLNPSVDADSHMDALEFLRSFQDDYADGVLFDPPYSPRQVAEVYHGFGIEVGSEDTQARFWGDQKKEISRVVKTGGKVLTFGWNSGGIGAALGFDITRILLVPHGGWHNDTICTVEVKRAPRQMRIEW